MFANLLAVSCYLPNSTFAYNPVTHQGTLKASYGPQDATSDAICTALHGKLVRGRIYLTNNEQLLSDTFLFSKMVDIAVVLRASTPAQHTEAQQTTESTFELEFLELQENIQQTLASYQIQSFDYSACLTNFKIDWHETTLTIYGKLEACNYNITNFATSEYATGELFMDSENYATMDITASLNAALSSSTGDFTYVLDCYAADFYFPEVCIKIIERITKYVLYELYFKIRLELEDPPGKTIMLSAQIQGVYDATVTGCFTGQYTLTDGLAIIDIFKDTSQPRCTVSYEHAYIQGGYLSNLEFSKGRYWFFNLSIDEELGDTFRFYVQCEELPDKEACEADMMYVERLPQSWFKFRTFFVHPDQTFNFFGLTLVRRQWCYSGITATLQYDHSGAPIIQLQFQRMVSDECEYVQMVRTLLRLVIYERYGEFFGEHSDTELCTLSQRSEFSVNNETLSFAMSDSEVRIIQKASARKKISAYFILNEVEIPVLHIEDRLMQNFAGPIVGISVGGGALFGIIGFLMNMPFAAFRKNHGAPKLKE